MNVRQWSMWYCSTAAGTFADATSEAEADRKARKHRERHPDLVIEITRVDFVQAESEPQMVTRMLPRARLKRTKLS